MSTPGLPFLIFRPHNIMDQEWDVTCNSRITKNPFYKKQFNLFSRITQELFFIDDAIKIIFKLVTNKNF